MEVPDQALDDQDPHEPGQVLGMFTVQGKLGDDSCEPAMDAPQSWDFQVKLSRETDALYWLNGTEAIVGSVDDSGNFGFDTHVNLTLSEPHGAAKGCTVVRRDTLAGTLSGSSAFTATLSYQYEEAPGSECAALPLGADGSTLTLPCALGYALEGKQGQ